MSETTEVATPKWAPIEAIDRRVLGVLVEKAKTTPDNYPLTLKGLISGANQKSNRFPQMEVDDDRVEESLDRLRGLGAVSIIQGDGRVEKYRHLAYDWLGVDKVELAVMAELLLRGAQTIGELRGRAARMEPIKSMSELGPLLQSLQAKSLVIYLTPPGRGAVVTHTLYLPREMEKVQREHGVNMPADGHPAPPAAPPAAAEVADPVAAPTPAAVPPGADASSSPPPADGGEELHGLREELAHVRTTLAGFRDETEVAIAQLQQELADLQRQLGN